MLYFHPALQCTGLTVAVWALMLGISRFRAMHLKHKIRFNWKKHVLLGKVALAILLIGGMSGILVVRFYWGAFFVTGAHWKVGLVILCLIIFGLWSGLHMDKVKKRRTALPILHGLNNATILILSVFQIITGLQILKNIS